MERGSIRRAVSVALAAVLMSAGAVIATPVPAHAAATSLYPNLRTLPPRLLRFDRTDVSPDGTGVLHNVLRFSNTSWNAGEGRFELRSVIDPTTKSGVAYQRIYDNAGGFVDKAVGSIYYHAAHNHYHFDNWGRFELWTKAAYDSWVASGRTQGSPQWVSPKTTSCITDEEAVQALAGTPATLQYPWQGCNLASDNTLKMGLSPGWGDTYDYYRYEQWIDLNQSTLADGQYVLRSVTDPNNVLWESDQMADPSREGDNEAATPITVAGGALQDTVAPSGTLWINGVDTQTSNPIVDLKMVGRDDIGVDAVRISNDGVTWAPQQAFTGVDSTPMEISWDMTDSRYGGTTATGNHTVYVEFHDASGKWSSPVTDTIALVSCAASSSSSGYATAVTADAPVSYWRLGDACGSVATDDRAANPGTYQANPALGQPSLLPADGSNTAVGFNGSTASVLVPQATSLNFTSAFSLEAWIRPNSVPSAGGWASVLSKPESYSLQFNGPQLEFTVIQSGTRRRLQAPAGAVVAGTTYHVVATYDGATQRLYINGAQVASAALAGGATVTTNPIHLASWDGSGEFFWGTIDDAAVYNKALSAAQVANHNTKGRSTTLTPPIAPSGLAATATGTSSASLSWTDNSADETGFVLERSTSSTFTTVTARTFAPDTTTYADSGLAATTTYYYRVKATNGAGDSAYSNAASATTTSAAPSYASTILADGPVSYWRLGEASGTSAGDSQGLNPGSYVNGPLLGQTSLLPADTTNTAVRFDGVNDQVNVAAATSLNFTSAFSLETWIKPNAIPAAGGWASVMTKPEAYSIQFNGPRLEFTVIQGGARRRLQAPSGAVVAGTTYHVVATFDGTTQRLYLNGALAASAALTGAASVTTTALHIGSWDGSGEFFNGIVDEVAVYNKVLTATQVASHNTKGRTG